MMHFVNRIFFSLILLFFSLVSFSQASVEGKISDEGQDLPSVTVLLLNTDSSVVQGVITDSIGKFVFKNVLAGQYMISASMVGYSKFLSSSFNVQGESVVVPDIVLVEATIELNEVVVKENKQRFDQKIDRLVINLEGSITASGNTILEVLQKSPGVIVNRQDNSIKLNGKAGVRIMINNKIIQLPIDAVIPMLEGMNASNVEKIELITAPPSEYDAEGNGGIIHIVTKSREDFGTNGSFGLVIGARWAETLGANFNLQHRNKKAAYFLDYSVLRNHNQHIANIYRRYVDNDFVQTVSDYSRRENLTIQQNLSAGVEWQLAKNTSINVLFTGYSRNWDLTAHAQDRNQVSIDSTAITDTDIHESNIWKSASASLGLQTKIDAKSDISFSVDYIYYRNDNPSSYDNTVSFQGTNTYERSKTELSKTTPIHILVAKADYEHRISPSVTWQAGIKSVTSTLDNNVLVERLVDGVWTTDHLFTSYSTLNERIYAGYVSTHWHVGNQVQIDGGLRYEYTHTSISSPGEKNLIERKYGYFFPSLSAKKNLAPEKDLEFSYTRRITRPTYNDIAPYIFLWGPSTFSAGNTSLYPALSDALSVGYHVKQWTVSLQYSHIRNEITMMQPEVDGENTLIYRSQNLKHLNTWGLGVTNSVSVTRWWEIQSSFTAQYQSGKTSYLPNNVFLHLFNLNINVVNQLKLPKDFAAEISVLYQSKLLSGISRFLPFGSLNVGVQKNFGKQGIIRLSMDDILSTNNWRIETKSKENNLDSYFGYDWHNRYIRLTYTRSLGNTKLRSVNVGSGSEEERRRVGN